MSGPVGDRLVLEFVSAGPDAWESEPASAPRPRPGMDHCQQWQDDGSADHITMSQWSEDSARDAMKSGSVRESGQVDIPA